jgi:cell division protease FtsH
MPPARAPRKTPTFTYVGWAGLLLLFALLTIAIWLFTAPKAIPYSDFLKLAKAGRIQKAIFIGNERVEAELKPDALDSKEAREAQLKSRSLQANLPANEKLTEKLMDILTDAGAEVGHQDDPFAWLSNTFIIFVCVAAFIVIFFLFIFPRMRDSMGGPFINNYIKSPARRYDKTKASVTFNDVADMENAKSEMREVVEFLRDPQRFQRLGAQVPKGVMLVGPPGTGKTLLARAAAGEADVPFYSINGAEFIQLFVGVGASRVRDLFKTAKENAPCLIFIDEIDAVGRMRGAGLGGGSDEREQTLNQILGEMDGFQPTDMIIVLAATNRPDVLDPALLRPGRFDRHITVDRQNWQGRLAVLRVHTRNKPLAPDVDLEAISRQMTGMTGADLRNLANEAALLATREGKNKIERIDFERAADRVLIGPKREEVLSPEEKRVTAYHEAGHALITWLIDEADRPMKVSIVPRGRTLGVNIIVPEEEKYHRAVGYFKAKLATFMGGRAAEKLVYKQFSAGVEDDLHKATKLARYMVTHWGMSERVGPVSLPIGEEHVFLGKDIQQARDFSDGMAQIVDEEVQKLLREAEQQALELLQAHRSDLDRLVEQLLLKEELSRAEIEQVLKPPSVESNSQAVTSIPR